MQRATNSHKKSKLRSKAKDTFIRDTIIVAKKLMMMITQLLLRGLLFVVATVTINLGVVTAQTDCEDVYVNYPAYKEGISSRLVCENSNAYSYGDGDSNNGEESDMVTISRRDDGNSNNNNNNNGETATHTGNGFFYGCPSDNREDYFVSLYATVNCTGYFRDDDQVQHTFTCQCFEDNTDFTTFIANATMIAEEKSSAINATTTTSCVTVKDEFPVFMYDQGRGYGKQGNCTGISSFNNHYPQSNFFNESMIHKPVLVYDFVETFDNNCDPALTTHIGGGNTNIGSSGNSMTARSSCDVRAIMIIISFTLLSMHVSSFMMW